MYVHQTLSSRCCVFCVVILFFASYNRLPGHINSISKTTTKCLIKEVVFMSIERIEHYIMQNSFYILNTFSTFMRVLQHRLISYDGPNQLAVINTNLYFFFFCHCSFSLVYWSFKNVSIIFSFVNVCMEKLWEGWNS